MSDLFEVLGDLAEAVVDGSPRFLVILIIAIIITLAVIYGPHIRCTNGEFLILLDGGVSP